MTRGFLIVALGAMAAIAALLAIACGGGDDRFVLTNTDAPFVPVIESTDLAVGVDRVVLRLLDRAAAPSFAAGTTFQVRYFEPVQGGLRFRSDAALEVVAVGPETFYVGAAPLDVVGTWALEVRAVAAGAPDDAAQVSARLPFVVAATTASPAMGDRAPESPSLRSALAAGRPALVVLTLSDDCSGSALCDRALAQAERLAAAMALAVVAERAPANGEGESGWTLENEPWTYVVGTGGRILARFERLATDSELQAAITRATAAR